MSFKFAPAAFIPFRDTDAIERVIRIKREDIEKHHNPDFRIKVYPDAVLEPMWIDDMFQRIKSASDEGRQLVMIMPNPWPSYATVAALINKHRINCHFLHTFNMDEYADQDGNIAPESWEFGFNYAFLKHFIANIDPELRPPAKQVHLFKNDTLADYGKRMADLGGADVCYSGPGWSGHLAFIEPDAPEFAAASLDEWKKLGPRVCTLGPLTIAQNSLHGCFGASGNLCAVPPKAATIGPAEVVGAKFRIDMHSITVGGSFQSWQRLTTRLVLHGPVTPLVPESILQTLRTDVWLSETAAANIEPRWDLGY